MSPGNPDPAPLPSRTSKVVLAIAIVTAVSGYFMGLRQTTRSRAGAETGPAPWTAPPSSAPARSRPDDRPIPTIVEYRRLGETPLRPNARWRSSLADLRTTGTMNGTQAGVPGPAATPPLPASDLERQLAVGLRSARRAFDGAPPVIPHPVDQDTPANCRACHAEGLAVRGVTAPKMSHGELGNCIQCHVPRSGPMLASNLALPQSFGDNAFLGVVSAGRGSRAWPGSPPTIPHATWMRQDCSSCHGPTGLAGLRTSHPERTSCLQCHVPDGQADVPPWLRPELAGPVPTAGLNPPR